MNHTTVFFLAVGIGFVAGLRALTAPAAVSWAAHLHWLAISGTRLGFLGSSVSVGIFAVLALVEFITDQLPSTPSRKAPPGFIARILTGALSGGAIGIAGGVGIIGGALLGVVGALIGTNVGYELRTRLVKALNIPDFVIATLEDAVAIGAALLIVTRF